MITMLSARGRVQALAAVCLIVALFLLPVLKLFSGRINFFDLGHYVNSFYMFSEHWNLAYLFSTHVQLFILPYSIISKVFQHSMIIPLLLQSAAMILGYFFLRSAVTGLDRSLSVAIFIVYFGNLSLWFSLLNDFHFEHLLFILVPAFMFLLRSQSASSSLGLLLAALGVCAVKEPYALSAIMMGVLAFLSGRRSIGTLIILISSAYFVIATTIVIPHFTQGRDVGALWGQAFGYLGATPVEMAKRLITNPLIIFDPSLWTLRKVIFIVALLGPFIWFLRYSPLLLLPTLPSLAISMLSREPDHSYLGHHYTAMISAVCLAALPAALSKISQLQIQKLLLYWTSAVTVMMLVLFGPSPISRLFFSNFAWSYHYQAYWPDARWTQIQKLIDQHIPTDPRWSVSMQNSVVTQRLLHRPGSFAFPNGVFSPDLTLTETGQNMALADFVVIDRKRPLSIKVQTCVWNAQEICTDPKLRTQFDTLLAQLPSEFTSIARHDGFEIYRRK